LAQIFYHGLDNNLRNFVDASCGGTFLNKYEKSAFELFESMSENLLNNASMAQFKRSSQPRGGIYEVQTNSGMVDMDIITKKSNQVELVVKKIDELLNQSRAPLQTFPLVKGAHNVDLVQSMNQVHLEQPLTMFQGGTFVPSNPDYSFPSPSAPSTFKDAHDIHGYSKPDPFSSTYNLGWRNHPNFSWLKQ
jgi:hypothetical protein